MRESPKNSFKVHGWAMRVLQGQESIRGQVVLRAMGIGEIPVINVENACTSSEGS